MMHRGDISDPRSRMRFVEAKSIADASKLRTYQAGAPRDPAVQRPAKAATTGAKPSASRTT